jgi:hypothetical protein
LSANQQASLTQPLEKVLKEAVVPADEQELPLDAVNE